MVRGDRNQPREAGIGKREGAWRRWQPGKRETGDGNRNRKPRTGIQVRTHERTRRPAKRGDPPAAHGRPAGMDRQRPRSGAMDAVPSESTGETSVLRRRVRVAFLVLIAVY